MLIASCKKEVEGPQGPKGDTGNANVMVFNYGTRTFSSGFVSYTIPNISQEVMDKSLVLVYYNPSVESASSWYAIPGLASGGFYDTRYLVYKDEASSPDYKCDIRLINPATNGTYTGEVTFTKLKIVIAPASSSTNVLTPLRNEPDYTSYSAVKAHYGLED